MIYRIALEWRLKPTYDMEDIQRVMCGASDRAPFWVSQHGRNPEDLAIS